MIPDKIKEELADIGLWDVDPRNLFRITWKNEPKEKGGGFDGVNYVEVPKELTGVDARIIALVGKWFPTGRAQGRRNLRLSGAAPGDRSIRSHVSQAVWPSTGNYCRGGAYDASLLACESIAILPEG